MLLCLWGCGVGSNGKAARTGAVLRRLCSNLPGLEHFPTKWIPVRRRKCDQTKKPERLLDFIGLKSALACLRAAAITSVVTATFNLTTPQVQADDLTKFTREAYAGADVTADVWLLYSGVTLAPTSDIYSDGIRLRAGGGYGQYRYSGHRAGDPKDTERRFKGTITYAEALIGYQKRFGELTAKAFVGVSAIDHTITPHDPVALGGLITQGLEFGVKGAIELWLNLGSSAWSSLDLAYTSAHDTYAARWRLGYRILPTVSAGLEAALNGNIDNADKWLSDGTVREQLKPQGRVGVFARYEWSGGEVSLAGGLSNSAYDFEPSEDGFDEIYGTFNWLIHF